MTPSIVGDLGYIQLKHIESTKQKRISEPARKCKPFNIDTTMIMMITAPHDEGIGGVSKVDPFLHQDESFQDLA